MNELNNRWFRYQNHCNRLRLREHTMTRERGDELKLGDDLAEMKSTIVIIQPSPGSSTTGSISGEHVQKHISREAERMSEKISVKREVMGGDPCIAGTRIPVALILNFLADGYTVEEVIAEFPHLSEEDIRAALAYAARTCGRPEQ